jgi:hypothetical protein
VTRINLVPHRGGLIGISPREAFLGVKADYKRDLRCAFGDYLECTVRQPDNSMAPRTEACIALLPKGTQGTIICHSMRTGHLVTRGAFQVLPINDNVILYMNDMAATDNQGVISSLSMSSQSNSIDDDGIKSASEDIDADVPIISQEFITDDITIEELSDTHISPTITETPSQDPPDEVEDTLPAPAVQFQPPETSIASRTRSRAAPISEAEYQRTRLTSHRRGADESTVFNLTIKKALANPAQATIATAAIREELQQMLDIGVFVPVKSLPPTYKKPIRSHMFLREKYDSEGNYQKMKARLVGGGNTQSRDELLYEDVSSPTAAVPFIFAIASLAAQERRHVVTADVPVAYLL